MPDILFVSLLVLSGFIAVFVFSGTIVFYFAWFMRRLNHLAEAERTRKKKKTIVELLAEKKANSLP